MNIRKRNGRYQVQVRRLGYKPISKTFAQKSDGLKWGRQVEVQLEQKRYKDISNASKTTLKSVLERHLAERVKLWSNYIFATILILTLLKDPESHTDYKVVVRMTIIVMFRKF